MADSFCRLCLSRDRLLYIFNPELTNSEQLRTCILICTGVNILLDDVVTKYVCHTCCEIAIKLFKFRKNALANDRALKNIIQQQDVKLSTDTQNIVQLNEFLVKRNGVRIRYGEELKKKLPTARRTRRYTVHPSVIRLVKCYPKIKLPEEVITVNCDPRVCARKLDVEELDKTEEVKVPAGNTSDLDIFKQRFPGISIVKLSGNDDSTHSAPVESDVKTNSDCEPSEEEINEEKEDCLKRKRDVDDAENELKKTKTTVKPSVDLKIPEPTLKIKEFLESFKAIDDTTPATTKEDNHHENLEVSMITANIQAESQSLQAESQSPQAESQSLQAESQNIQAESTISSSQPQNLQPSNDNNNESDTSNTIYSEGYLRELAQKKVLRPRKSRPSFFTNEAFYEDSDDDYVPEPYEHDEDDDENEGANGSLLQTFEVEMAFTCDICSKMFNHPTKLKLHRRMHKECIVCKKIFISQQTLKYHLYETCYKTVIANPPTLCLERCDSKDMIVEPEVVDVLCISDDDDDEIPSTQNPHGAEFQQMDSKEQQKVIQIIEKYNRHVPPYHKSAACQENAQLYKAVMAKGQATMTNMYPILKYFRIPVIVQAADTMKVEMVDRVNQQPPPSQNWSWTGVPIKNLSNLVNAKKIGGRTIAPKPAVPSQQQEATNAQAPVSQVLKNMFEHIPSACATAKLKQLQMQNSAAVAVTTASTQPLLLKSLQSEPIQNPPLILNNIQNDRILAIQVATQPKLSNIIKTKPPQVIQPQYSIQTQRPLPAMVPKTYTAKPRPQPVYQTIQTQNIVSQIQSVTQPTAITVQQPPPTYIQTAAGYVMSGDQTTFTTPQTYQSTFASSIAQNTFTPVTQTTFITTNQNTINPNQAFSVANHNLLTGAGVTTTCKTMNTTTPLTPTSINTLTTKRPLPKLLAQNGELIKSGANEYRIILPKKFVQNTQAAANQQQSTPENTPDVAESPQIIIQNDKEPVEVIDLDNENTQNEPKTVPTIKPLSNEGGNNYIRVKAPWELNGI